MGALSGKPSIGVSGFLEQECNGMALEKLGVSRHFTLKSLYSDYDAVKAFGASITSFFDRTALSFVSHNRLLEVQNAVQNEQPAAFHAFLDKLRELAGKSITR